MEEIKEPVIRGYIGTYYSEESKGIYQFTFNEASGEMTEPQLFYEAKNAKWVSLYGNSLVFPMEKDGHAGICFLELDNGKGIYRGEILEEKQTPCYIMQDGNFVYTANYHEGTVMVYQIRDGKLSVIKRIENGEGAGCHQILLHESYLMVPCLMQHRIRLFDIEHEYAPAGELTFPKGSGPRHGLFNQDHTKFYVVSEWSNELFVYEVEKMTFRLVQTLSLLKQKREGKDAAAAAIRLTKDERFLYISVRGQDVLIVVDVSGSEASVIQQMDCQGEHPRDMILSGNEKFVIVANRFSGGIVSFVRDSETGKLAETQNRIQMPEGVAVVLNNENR